MNNDPYRPPPSTDGTSWWIGQSREQFSEEIKSRFAVNRADEKARGGAAYFTAEAARRAADSRRKGGANATKSKAASKGSVLMPTAHTLRSEFVQQERVSVSDLRSAGLL